MYILDVEDVYELEWVEGVRIAISSVNLNVSILFYAPSNKSNE